MALTAIIIPLASVLDSFQSSILFSGSRQLTPLSDVSWGQADGTLHLGYDGTNSFATGAVLFDMGNAPALSSGQAIANVYHVAAAGNPTLAGSESQVIAINTNTGGQLYAWHTLPDGTGRQIAIPSPGRALGSDWRTDINALQAQYNGYRGGSSGPGPIAAFADGYFQANVYDRPSVSVYAVTTPVTNTARPTINWAFTTGGGGLGQTHYRVLYFTAAQYGIGGFNPQSSPNTWDSGWVTSTSTAYTIPTNLTNGTTYRAYVMVAQTLPVSLYRHESVDGTTLASLGSSQYTQFTITLATPPVPTAVQPVAASTVTTDLPTLRATLAASAVASTFVRAEWQLATDAGFTANLRTLTMGTGEQVVSGTVTKDCQPGTTELFQGTWYVRARSLDSNGASSAWTSAQSFTVAHPPSMATLGPIGQSSRVSGDTSFSFTFSDTSPTDFQTAFQLVVERDSDGFGIYDSGKQVSAASSFLANISSTYNDVLLRWKIRGYDSDDVVGSYSTYAQWYPRSAPVIVPGAPADPVVQPQPTYDFTLSGGRQIAQYRFATYIDGTLTIVDDSGWKSGTVASYTVTALLDNAEDYHLIMYVLDEYGIGANTSVDFSTMWEPPDGAIIAVDPDNFDITGSVDVSWPENRDAQFVNYRVYYKRDSETLYSLLGEITDDSLSTYTFEAFDIPANVPGAIAVTQSALRFGVAVESSPTLLNVAVAPVGTHYFLLVETDSTLNIRLSRINSDSFTEEWEQEEIKLLGRGRRVEKGTRWGFTGSLSGRAYDDSDGLTAAQQRTALEALKAARVTCILRTPFGDRWKVALGDIEISRMAGVGINAYFDFTLPYTEVLSELEP